ncbi:MAG TPA: hypothetical protein VET29_29680, partial [Actinophytocola sp.]|nr:hypothetical protein [Actinophytocola sp.]
GHGHLAERAVRVGVRGRGAATRATETCLYLPAEGGAVRTPTDSFGALGTDRLSPPAVDAPKDPFVPVPREVAPADPLPLPAFPLSASPAPLSSRPSSLSLAPPLPASPAAIVPPASPAVARLAAARGPASPACGFTFEQDDPTDDTVLAGHGA